MPGCAMLVDNDDLRSLSGSEKLKKLYPNGSDLESMVTFTEITNYLIEGKIRLSLRGVEIPAARFDRSADPNEKIRNKREGWFYFTLKDLGCNDSENIAITSNLEIQAVKLKFDLGLPINKVKAGTLVPVQ